MSSRPKTCFAALLASTAAMTAHAQTQHIPPDPPQPLPAHTSYEKMAELMQMDDKARHGRVLLNQAEWRDADAGDAYSLQGQASYGSDYNKLYIKTEADRVNSVTERANAELLWDRVVARWWSLQTGVRHDFGVGPSREWLALGVAGVAPQWFQVEATLYAGEAGRTALRVRTDYEMLFTQRLVLQPEFEAHLYGKEDRERGIGSGLSQVELGMRLRYEIKREFAPYIGVEWTRKFGGTADLSPEHEDSSAVSAVAGLRIWF